MSYLAFARRYRPRRFEEVIGQEHVVRALTNALEHNRLHHAYLFCGTRGVGKTSIARLLARCLNCEQGMSAQPCGTCETCRAIDSGRFVDLIEVDAASRTRVEETRDLLESVPYSPARGRFKVYLIDEVHMLSNSSFNALLKTLEEPPEHVKFLFATTEPERIPLTVRSRCLVFSLRRASVDEIILSLQKIVAAESLSADPAVFEMLAVAARGSLRDAQSLLDQALSYGGGALRADEVAEMLGLAGQEAIYRLLEPIASGDGTELLVRLQETLRGPVEPISLLDALTETLARVAREQLIPQAAQPAGIARESIAELAQAFKPEAVQLNYDIAVAGRKALSETSNPELALEMVLLRMLAFRPVTIEPSSPQMGKSSAGTRPSERGKGKQSEPASVSSPAVPRPAEPAVDEKRAERRDTSEDASAPVSTKSGVRDKDTWDGDWEHLVKELPLGAACRELAYHCRFVGWNGNAMKLHMEQAHEALLVTRLREELEQALEQEFGRPVRLLIEIQAQVDTPAKRRSARRVQHEREVKDEFMEDGMVQQLKAEMGAELIAGSIRVDSQAPTEPNREN